MSKRSRSRAESPELGSPPARNKSSGLRWPLIQKLISKAVAPCSSQRDADAAMDAVLAQVQLTRLTTLEAASSGASAARMPSPSAQTSLRAPERDLTPRAQKKARPSGTKSCHLLLADGRASAVFARKWQDFDSVYLGHEVLRTPGGRAQRAAKRGKITAWAPKESSSFVDDAGQHAPLWKVEYEDASEDEEELEEQEVKDAIIARELAPVKGKKGCKPARWHLIEGDDEHETMQQWSKRFRVDVDDLIKLNKSRHGYENMTARSKFKQLSVLVLPALTLTDGSASASAADAAGHFTQLSHLI